MPAETALINNTLHHAEHSGFGFWVDDRGRAAREDAGQGPKRGRGVPDGGRVGRRYQGLFLLPRSNDPELDLEAGAAFAFNVSVYLPAVALCLLLVVALPVSVLARRGATVGVMACLVVCAFALRVLTEHALLEYLPGLRAALWLATGLAFAAVVSYCVAYAVQPCMTDSDVEGARAERHR